MRKLKKNNQAKGKGQKETTDGKVINERILKKKKEKTVKDEVKEEIREKKKSIENRRDETKKYCTWESVSYYAFTIYRKKDMSIKI